MPSSVLIHQLPRPFPFCQGPEATAPAVPLPPVPASGLVANVGSLRCQERKRGMVCALTFISDWVGRKAEEKLGVGRKLRGLVRKKLSLINRSGICEKAAGEAAPGSKYPCPHAQASEMQLE